MAKPLLTLVASCAIAVLAIQQSAAGAAYPARMSRPGGTIADFVRATDVCSRQAHTLGLTSYSNRPIFYDCMRRLGYQDDPHGFGNRYMSEANRF